MHISILKGTNEASLRINWLIAVFILLLTGMVYRGQACQQRLINKTPVSLPLPLKSFPFILNDWSGRDIPIPKTIQKAAGNDDFVNRFYHNKTTNNWATVYIAYSGSPRTMLGHRPDICYVGGGWVHDSTEQSQFTSSSGKAIPCLIHRFHKPSGGNEETFVLNFYVLNGEVIRNEKGFSGLEWRLPNINGNPAYYVAQVQISSVLENSVRCAAADLSDLILDYFPDSQGNVRAVKFLDIPSIPEK